MPKKKTSPFRKKIVAFQKKVNLLLTFLTSQKNLLVFRKQVKSTFTMTLSKIAVFYKKSEFNRGLVIGLGLTLVFFVGYTAKAALPTTNDLESLNQASYDELFPSGYLKPHEMKFFRYYVDATNNNTSEVAASGGKIVKEANELVVYDDRADTDVKFEFFTDKINNTIAGEPNIDSCKLANQARSGACGKMLRFDYKFYKHVEFFPDSRGSGVPPHMYFYDKDEVVKIYVNNAIVPNTGVLQNAALSILKHFNLDKIMNTNVANAQMAHQQAAIDDDYLEYENLEPDIPASKKYFITGKISQLISAGILDSRVFKSKTILERSGVNSSYFFTGMTAEPKSKYINNSPEAYDYATYFNTSVNSLSLNDYYKKEIKKLTLKDTYSFNSTTKTWTNISNNPVYREIKLIDNGNNINEFFYNTSFSNFINIKTNYLAGLVYNVKSSAGGFQRMYVYKGDGTTAQTIVHNVSIRVGNISNNPCVYSDIPCQSSIEFKEAINSISLSPKISNSLLSFLIPKRANAQSTQFGDGGFTTLASGNTSMKSMIDSGILSGHMFRPSAHFAMNNPNKSKLYWKKEIVAHDYNENPPEIIPSLFEDLSKNGTGAIHTANFAPLLSYYWVTGYDTGQYRIAGSMVGGGTIVMGHNSTLAHNLKTTSNNLFKFQPNLTNPSNPGTNILLNQDDSNILDETPPSGSTTFIKACLSLSSGSPCMDSGQGYNGLKVMDDYVIKFSNVDLGDQEGTTWQGSGNFKYKYVYLRLDLYSAPGNLKDTKFIPILILDEANDVNNLSPEYNSN